MPGAGLHMEGASDSETQAEGPHANGTRTEVRW